MRPISFQAQSYHRLFRKEVMKLLGKGTIEIRAVPEFTVTKKISSRAVEFEQVHQTRKFQNGDVDHDQSWHPTKRLNGVNRFDGNLSSCSDTSDIRKYLRLSL